MSAVATTTCSQAEDTLHPARELPNETAGSVFTDTFLLPLPNSANAGSARHGADRRRKPHRGPRAPGAGPGALAHAL
jgi:hypothetical protein